MEKEFFDLLGLGVPFGLATATYVVFTWLDSNASDRRGHKSHFLVAAWALPTQTRPRQSHHKGV